MAVNIDFMGAPKESLVTLLERYHNMFLILDDVLASKRSFRIIFQDILDIMKYGFDIRQIRHKKISFKIHEDDKEIHTLKPMHFLSNLILLEWCVEEEDSSFLTPEFIHNFTNTTIEEMADYTDKYILPYAKHLDFHQQSAVIDEIWYKVVSLSNAFGPILGMGISVKSIIDMEKQNPEITEIMYGKIDEALQPKEVEEELMRRTDRMIELFSTHDNDLKPMFLSGKNLTPAQFKEICVGIGLVSGLDGETVPYIINTNILIHGINKPSYFYLKALSARKALVLAV